jgi:GMP synthase (glutamine-hydrolysing)
MMDTRHGGIAVLDFGSQTAQLIARRIRDIGVYAALYPWDTPEQEVRSLKPRGLILSGGPRSVYEAGAGQVAGWALDSGLPILGICYGMQTLAHNLGGEVSPAESREYGPARITLAPSKKSPLFAGLPAQMPVWMSHGDRVEALPAGWEALAYSENSPYAAVGRPDKGWFGVQFHPEVQHTPQGVDMLGNFAFNVCGCGAYWTPEAFINAATESIREQVGDQRVILGLSGGVDSAVTAMLVHRAVGDQLTSVFINNGLLRLNEADQVVRTFRDERGLNLRAVDATETFLSRLDGIIDPEEKRRIIGRTFIDEFSAVARDLGDVPFLAQGTIYPDVIESAAPDRPSAHKIKTHHNVGGLPEDLAFELVEPLRYLFKDEVRQIGAMLGMPDAIVRRQPFPGPGLAIRCIGAITWERLEALRQADAIFLEELHAAGWLPDKVGQAFAVLTGVRSVGVMGDARTYREVAALRAVITDDFMTADWAHLPHDLLARVSNRIVNEVKAINRVVYDISSKPPATIEWE